MAMKRLKAKKRAQAKRNSQSNGVPAQQEIPTKEEDSAKEEVPAKEPAKEENPAKGQDPARGQNPTTENQWTRYPIETEFIAKMEPLSYPVTRDLEHEVICDFNLDDAMPVDKYMPEIACSQGMSLVLMQNYFAVELTQLGERPRYSHPTKVPFQLDPLDIPPKHGFGWLFNALVRNIKAAKPDFRFDNIDIIAHAGTLACCSMYFRDCTPENVRELGQMRFQLWGNALFIYNCEEVKGGQIGGLHNAMLLAITSKDWRRPFRAVRYNFGGLNCLVVFDYEVLCPDPSTITATDEGNSVPKNAHKGKAMTKPDNNTENSIAKYTATIMLHKYDDASYNTGMISREVPFDWFTRLDYHIRLSRRPL
ncbi:hypothetical protein NW766_001907 [Fusarium irregulare]|uniref:Uncharacterized protein n=1 Tax=Fusarium irregulare TaxID=2494466 RepID=A0A9W8UDK5_9HYPO|nr:hypothetical protein NW766_001907 [Fusarium irregulare]